MTHSPSRIALRPYHLPLLIASYTCLSCLPFISLWGGRWPEQLGRLALFELASWIVIFAVFKRLQWVHLCLLPAFLAAPIEIYLRLFFGQGISTHHLGIITETSPQEAMEFLGRLSWLVLVIYLIILLVWWRLWRTAKQHKDWGWTHRSRWGVIMIVACASLVWTYGREVGVASASGAASASDSTNANAIATETEFQWYQIRAWEDWERFLRTRNKLPAWASVFYDEESFARSWPLGIWVRMVDYVQERRYLNTLSEKNARFRFEARQVEGKARAQTVVLVLGESSRYDRWSLNGYERDTTPLLRQEGNLHSFSNMITAVSATRLSIPVIMTRKPATQSLKPGFSEKSLISAFKEAGFHTYWLSNQMSFGQFDTPSSVIAKEADQTQFFNLGGFTNGSSLDAVLLPALERSLNDAYTKKLIVIHSLGNHWNYSHRHPREFDRWKPSLFGVHKPAYTNLKNKEAINNSYDNSILYTDWFLSQVIQRLKQAREESAMFYISDHGQTLYDGSCNLAFHGHNTQYEFHVAALMWYSDRYAQHYPEKIDALKRHKDQALSTENVFHSMLDMVDIRYPDQHLERSFLSSQWRYFTRYVDSYGWSNYDDATFKGDCREVMDRGSPLVQEK